MTQPIFFLCLSPCHPPPLPSVIGIHSSADYSAEQRRTTWRQMRKKMCRGPPSPPPAHDATGRGDTPLQLLHGKKRDFPSSWHVRGFPILAPLFSSPPLFIWTSRLGIREICQVSRRVRRRLQRREKKEEILERISNAFAVPPPLFLIRGGVSWRFNSPSLPVGGPGGHGDLGGGRGIPLSFPPPPPPISPRRNFFLAFNNK